jgi:CBS domain-containing protein/Flp pilus assembly pilin Flp
VHRATNSPSLARHPRNRSFAVDPCGAAAIEYALLLALLAAGFFLATRWLGTATREPLAQVTAVIQSETTAGGATPSPASPPATVPAEPPRREFNWRAAGVLLSLCLNVLLWYLLIRRTRRERLRRQEAPETSSEALTVESLYQLRQTMLKVLTANAPNLFDGRLQVRHVLTREPCYVAPGVSAAEVAKQLDMNQQRYALVCDEQRKLLGIIHRSDLGSADGFVASDVMTINPPTVEPTALIGPTISLMLTKGRFCLPVVDDQGRAYGLLATFDLVLALQCTLMALQTMSSQNELATTFVRHRTISDIVERQMSDETAQDSAESLA